jgi:hypothetical protein
MEIVEINGNTWKKYIGDEGQDVYVATKVINQNEVIGKYVDETSYDLLIENDTDMYLPPIDITDTTDIFSESQIAFKFRKNVFTEDEQNGAIEGLWDAAVETNNRGMAAGPRIERYQQRDWVTPFQYDILEYYIKGQPQSVDGSDQIDALIEKHKSGKYETRGVVWLRTKVENEFTDYKNFFPKAMKKLASLGIKEAQEYAKFLKKKLISGTSYASPIWSGIAGYYGRYPRIPYGRPTSYTENNLDKFAKSFPFARKLESEFKRLLPFRYAKQKQFADRLDNKFLIGEDTTFTTITVNTTTHERNARMACHRDAGSLNEGFSNLTVVTKDGKGWKGGYLVTPEVRTAINVRPGDLLLIDNMRIIHGNTAIEPPDSGENDMLRMSLVYYFREDMDELGSYEYESIRRKYVDDRRLNKKHPLWKEYWNGVSPDMWIQKEWYDYLEMNGGRDIVEKYHSEAYNKTTTLEEFFS